MVRLEDKDKVILYKVYVNNKEIKKMRGKIGEN